MFESLNIVQFVPVQDTAFHCNIYLAAMQRYGRYVNSGAISRSSSPGFTMNYNLFIICIAMFTGHPAVTECLINMCQAAILEEKLLSRRLHLMLN